MVARKIQVFGKVQGVFFRATTKTQADNLGLSGWVRNEPDKTVLIEVEGPEDKMNTFIGWCKKGPQFAKVTSVSVEETESSGLEGFKVRY